MYGECIVGSTNAHKKCWIVDQSAQPCQRLQMIEIVRRTDQEEQVRQATAAYHSLPNAIDAGFVPLAVDGGTTPTCFDSATAGP